MSEQPTKKVHLGFISLIICSATYAQLLGLGYIPLLPILSSTFHVTHNTVQFLIATYLVGFSISQIGAGLLADRFGRRPMFFAGVSLGILGSLLCIFTPLLILIFVGLFLEAVGVGFIVPIDDTLISEKYPNEAQSKPFFALITASLAVGGILAPFVGGTIAHYYSWHWVFTVLCVVGVGLFLFAIKFAPETLKHKKLNLQFSDLKNLFIFFIDFKRHPLFFKVMIFSGLLLSITNVFNASAPILLHRHLHLGVHHIGWVLMGYNAVQVCGVVVASILPKRLSTPLVLLTSALLALMITVVILGIAMTSTVTLLGVILPYYGIAFFIGVATPCCWALLLSHYSQSASQAAAMLIFSQNLIFAVITSIVAIISEKTQLPVAIVTFIIVTLSCLSALSLKVRNDNRQDAFPMH